MQVVFHPYWRIDYAHSDLLFSVKLAGRPVIEVQSGVSSLYFKVDACPTTLSLSGIFAFYRRRAYLGTIRWDIVR